MEIVLVFLYSRQVLVIPALPATFARPPRLELSCLQNQSLTLIYQYDGLQLGDYALCSILRHQSTQIVSHLQFTNTFVDFGNDLVRCAFIILVR
jgi:hypothetical protein